MNQRAGTTITLFSRIRSIAIVISTLIFTPLLLNTSAGAQTGMSIAECFEGPATEFVNKFGAQNTLAKNMYEMKAGSVCAELATMEIETCLSQADKAGSNDGAGHYACIGKVANPCIDSAWGNSEFRHVVCVGTEEKVWLDILHRHLDSMLKDLPPELAEQAAKMKKSFLAFRNQKCGLIKTLKGKNEPDLAYGACTTETAARFAIDLRESGDLVKQAKADFARKQFTGDRQGAEKLLKRLLDGKADHHQLTMELRPEREDYEAAYTQPLAGQLEKDHLKLWADPRTAIRPQEGQTSLLLTVTSSDRLKKGGPELAEFPGGYQKVLPYLKDDVTIAVFKFVVPGEKKGMSFDGLVHVNGHWVLIPKPWNSLP